MSDYRLLGSLFLTLLLGCAPHAETEEEAATSAAAIGEAATITFDGAFRQTVTGPLVRGKTAKVVYDVARLTACRGEQGGIPQWSITGRYAIGDGPVKTFAAGGLSLRNGETTSITLDRAGDLRVWFENNDRWGCQAWDSAFGKDYHFDVTPAPTDPGWLGNVRYAIERQTCNGGPCEGSLKSFVGDITYETYARQRAAIRVVQFDVWKAGVTDHDDPDLWKKLDVQVHSRVVGSANPSFSQRWVSFDHRVGNDARYTIDLRDLDAVPGTPGAACPPYPLTKINEAYVEAVVELYVTVNGVELRPAGGTWRVRYQNYADLYRACAK